MPTAPVAYENAAEMKRKLKAVKPLRWHRAPNGAYKAKGARGEYTVFSRSPDRRRGVFPWVAALGGMRGAELKPGGFDLGAEAKQFAAAYDAGLCGAPASVVRVEVAPERPEGTYRGTLAGEKDKEPSDKYETEVTRAVAKMIGQGRGPDGTLFPATPDAYDIVGNSPEYVAQMEQGGVDPNIVAAVLVATKAHGHAHDCPAKHVELAEGAAENSRSGAIQWKQDAGGHWRGTSANATDGYFDVIPMRGGGFHAWWMTLMGDRRTVGEAIDLGSHGTLGGAFGASRDFLSEEGVAAEAKRRLWQPDPSSGYFITHSSLTRDNWLMKGGHLVFRDKDRSKVEAKARELTEGASERSPGSSEIRRPKGRSRR